MTKNCQQCGKEIIKQSGTSKKQWEIKKFCSVNCCLYFLAKDRMGKPLSEETKRKIGLANRGRIGRGHGWHHTKETALKISKARKGMIFSKEHLKNLSDAHKGIKLSEQAKIKLSKFNKGKIVSQETRQKLSGRKEEKSYSWKGDNVGYWGVHSWVRKRIGRPEKCKLCNKEGRKLVNGKWSIQLANKDHLYKRNLTDWIPLCISCHRIFDNQRI